MLNPPAASTGEATRLLSFRKELEGSAGLPELGKVAIAALQPGNVCFLASSRCTRAQTLLFPTSDSAFFYLNESCTRRRGASGQQEATPWEDKGAWETCPAFRAPWTGPGITHPRVGAASWGGPVRREPRETALKVAVAPPREGGMMSSSTLNLSGVQVQARRLAVLARTFRWRLLVAVCVGFHVFVFWGDFGCVLSGVGSGPPSSLILPLVAPLLLSNAPGQADD